MKTPLVAFWAILAGAILACTKATPEQIRKYTPTPTITSSPTPVPTLMATPLPISDAIQAESPSPTPDRYHVIAILAEFLNVREAPDGEVTGEVLKAGDSRRARCDGDWCELESGGYVWRGCTSDNPAGLGCESKGQ